MSKQRAAVDSAQLSIEQFIHLIIVELIEKSLGHGQTVKSISDFFSKFILYSWNKIQSESERNRPNFRIEMG